MIAGALQERDELLQGSYATVVGRHLTMPGLIVVLVIRRWDRRLIKMMSRRVALKSVRWTG